MTPDESDRIQDRRGKLFVISAPSGAGKTTLVHRLMQLHPQMRFSISYTTRRQRHNETDGIDYFFVSKKRFDEMVSAGDLLEHAEVFGNRYGTGRRQVDRLLAQGFDVLLEIDWQGARQVRANMPDCCSIFLLPPSIEELERRLRGRSTDEERVIRHRLTEALGDMSHWGEFDHVVINDVLDEAVETLRAIVEGKPAGTDTADPTVGARVRSALAGKA
jgi:guanylate kinase